MPRERDIGKEDCLLLRLAYIYFQHLIDNGDQPLGKAESDGLETIGVVSPKKCIDAR